MSHRYSWHTIPNQVGLKNALTKPFLPAFAGSCKVCHENVAKWIKVKLAKIGTCRNVFAWANFHFSREGVGYPNTGYLIIASPIVVHYNETRVTSLHTLLYAPYCPQGQKTPSVRTKTPSVSLRTVLYTTNASRRSDSVLLVQCSTGLVSGGNQRGWLSHKHAQKGSSHALSLLTGACTLNS